MAQMVLLPVWSTRVDAPALQGWGTGRTRPDGIQRALSSARGAGQAGARRRGSQEARPQAAALAQTAGGGVDRGGSCAGREAPGCPAAEGAPMYWALPAGPGSPTRWPQAVASHLLPALPCTAAAKPAAPSPSPNGPVLIHHGRGPQAPSLRPRWRGAGAGAAVSFRPRQGADAPCGTRTEVPVPASQPPVAFVW